jgi:membrane protease YdiL (CAAX protease family)
MTTADLLFLALIAVLLSLDHFVLWPGFLRRSEVDPGLARRWLWSAWMIMLWTLAAAGIVLWLFGARTWESLRLILPSGWRLWVATGLVLAFAIHNARTAITIVRKKRSKRVRMGHTHAERLAPHTRSELGWWVALSVSAGFCEEFIFRGYLIWAFQPMLGLWGAAALSVVVFAAAHAYQGVKSALATGVVACVLTAVVLIFGSLWPAIALHALADIGQGLVAWLVLRKVQDEGEVLPDVASQPGN